MAGADVRQSGAPAKGAAPLPAAPSRWGIPLRFARRKPLGALGGAIILVLLLMGLFGGFVAPYAYDDYDIMNRLIGPSPPTRSGVRPEVEGRCGMT